MLDLDLVEESSQIFQQISELLPQVLSVRAELVLCGAQLARRCQQMDNDRCLTHWVKSASTVVHPT